METSTITEATEHFEHQEAVYQSAEFWVGVAFVLVVMFLFKPIKNMIGGMQKKYIANIADRIDEAAKIKEDAQQILAEYEKKYKKAGAEAKAILNKANKAIEFAKNDSFAKMESDAKAKEKEVKNRILTSKENALKEVTNATINLTLQSLKEVIAQELDNKTKDRMIEESIDAIKNLKA